MHHDRHARAALEVLEGDARDHLRRLADAGFQVDSIVTDPPYGLVSVKKRFGAKNAAPARTEGNDGSFARLSKGFMGQTWDATGIERDPEFWRLCLAVLKPGGFCFAFSGSRTGHWQACAMERAGFIMHPMHGWVYSTGFPKAHSAAQAGPEWRGWAFGTQAQKPALEPIFLGQKPIAARTYRENLETHGVGAVNIDGCRAPLQSGEVLHVPQSDPTKRGQNAGKYCLGGRDTERMHAAQRASIEKTNRLGRHPANLLHDGSPEVTALFPDSNGSGPAQILRRGRRPEGSGLGMNSTAAAEALLRDAGTGSAARFFNSFDDLDTPAIFYHAKASKADRAGSGHPTVKPVGLLRHLIRHITPPGGRVLDPFAGSGTTGAAALLEGMSCTLIEAHPPYAEFLRSRFGLAAPSDPEVDALLGLADDMDDFLGV